LALVTLNAAFEAFSGKTGNAVFANTKDGTVFKNRPKKNDPKTPAQLAQRARMKKASQLFEGFTAAQADLWNDYGKKQPARTTKAGEKVHPTGIQAFTKLAVKFLAVNPTGTVPTVPPLVEFAGDTVVVTAKNNSGKLEFVASKANASTVTTELLLQELPSAARKPRKNAYRSEQFVSFATGSLTATFTVAPGYYAPAFRFVNKQTGQELALVPLPVVHVE
jgi:hypothetical protein